MRAHSPLSLWLPLSLALACTGPGLEPPQGPRENSDAAGTGAGVMGSAGVGGEGGMLGSGGLSGGSGAAGGAGLPVDSPTNDASVPVDEFDGSNDAGVDAGILYETQELTGPTYMGSVSNSAQCSMSYPTLGHEPAGSAQSHPLFLYFVGTAFVATDPSAQYDSPAALAVTEAMARRGFVALSVRYDNDAVAWLSDHTGQLACLFDGARPASLIAAACALPNVDCDLGIATWGHSQGGYVAAMAYNLESRVRAVWATGYGGDPASTLPKDRLRVVNGEADTDNGTAAKLNMITGLSPAECSDSDQCLRADGSGWIIVRAADLAMPATSTADHCWFERQSCAASAIALEPNWIDHQSDKPFALERNADWVARTTRR